MQLRNTVFKGSLPLVVFFCLSLIVTLGIYCGPVSGEKTDDAWEKPSLSGRIVSPIDKSLVERSFRVEGSIQGKTRHLWIIEKIGEMHWPKEPELIPRSGRWDGEVNEGGHPPGGRFQILLIDVSDKVDKRFKDWLEKGHRSGHYPGITSRDLEDYRILDRKDYRLES